MLLDLGPRPEIEWHWGPKPEIEHWNAKIWHLTSMLLHLGLRPEIEWQSRRPWSNWSGLHPFFSAFALKKPSTGAPPWGCVPLHVVCVYVADVCVCCLSVWESEYVPVSLYFCVTWKRSKIWFMCLGMCVLFCFQCFRVSLQIAIPIVWCDTLEERNDDFCLPQF
jgi:hypothetical protein